MYGFAMIYHSIYAQFMNLIGTVLVQIIWGSPFSDRQSYLDMGQVIGYPSTNIFSQCRLGAWNFHSPLSYGTRSWYHQLFISK